MNDVTSESPLPEPLKAEQVLYLPGYLFFVENIVLPASLEADEIPDFAELSVESIAPFPIEHLCWGFLFTDDAESILIYAAHRDRLKKEGYEGLDEFAWVLPDFVSLIGAHFPVATEVLLQSATSLSVLYYPSGSEIPLRVASLPRPEGGALEPVLQALRALSKPDTTPARSLRLQLSQTQVSEQGLPSFEHAPLSENGDLSDDGRWQRLSPSETALWHADVRSMQFKHAERNARRTGALLSRITVWAAVLVFILIALEIGLLAGQFWLDSLDSQINDQQPSVARIEDQQSLMNKLEQVAQNELRPVAILEALNTMRPRGIYFTGTLTEGENHITIDGIASTINELNRYTEILSSSGQFELIGSPKSITRAGTTTFTVTLAYNHGIAPPRNQRPPESTAPPGIPGLPETTPVTSATPATPLNSDIPGLPETSPTTPATPDIPGLPAAPHNPDIPGLHQNPLEGIL